MKRRVLIIGTEQKCDQIKALEDAGCAVETTASLSKAVELITSQPFADVLLDAELFMRLESEQAGFCIMDTEASLDFDWQLMLAEIVANCTEANLAYLDSNFNFVWVNASYAQKSGYKKEELLGKNHFDLFPNEENQRIFERVRDTGKPYTAHEKPFHYLNQPELGTTYWNWTLVPIRHKDDPIGTARGFTFTLVDVTSSVKARKEIERLREEALMQASQMTAVFNALSDAVIVYANEGRISYVNPVASTVYGISPDMDASVLPEKLSIRNMDDSPVHVDDLPSSRALKGETVEDQELNIVNAHGRKVTVVASASPLISESGVIGAVTVWHDVTEKRSAEQREREMEQKQLEFYRRTISAASQDKLIITSYDDIREIFGEPQETWEFFDVNKMVHTRRSVTLAAKTAGLSESKVNKVATCAGEMLSNAIKHAGGGHASIRTDEGKFLLRVADHGPGIEELNLPAVALIHRYSTVGTGGMGYKLTIYSADKVYLATGGEGTIVVMEFAIS
ncbi:MAG TPA: PAS domain S-box protein [Armatimonadota bacterium]|nr:PAS domain S-box protein [Armatimonadota bacterium]